MRSFSLAIVVLSLACGAQAPQSDSTLPEDGKSLAERRRERRVVKDLEHEIARLKAEVGTMRRGQTHAPQLPVEIREPAPPKASEPAEAMRTEQGEPVVVAGYDADGTEILYVGEAARAPAVRPKIELSGTGRPAPARRRPVKRKPLPPVPTAGDSLGVAKVGPKIDSAPSAAPVRERSARSKPRRRAFRTSSTDAKSDLAKSQYRAAYETLRSGKHEAAVALFRAFIAKHRRHDYADNAQYWLGEAFYDRRQFEPALAEFRKVIQNYPTGNKVAGAKLKVAYCHLALGHKDRTKRLLEKLVAQHPRTRPARLAAEKLKSL